MEDTREQVMSHLRSFFYITLADFLVRAAYQMGKTPLLPIFAATLGATEAFLGFILSVSTLTGMVLKPLIGLFSDRWGRRSWLLIGTIFFTVMPFLYRFVHTPEQLFFIRIVHGLATAIYGPVTLAYVAEQSQNRRAERLGWFGLARTAGYIVGPAAAGWMLLTMDPVTVFTMIGILSSVAFLPVLLLAESTIPRARRQTPLLQEMLAALKSGSKIPAVWLAGGLDATIYIALYAVKAFLPIYALSVGVNVALVGMFFALQEGVHILLNPFGGRLGDRWGYLWVVCIGMIVLGLSLPLLTFADHLSILMTSSVLMGMAQALVLPSTVALVSAQAHEQHIGTGMGLMGTLDNAGKVVGPVLGGMLIQWLDYTRTFHILGLLLILAALLIWCRVYWLPKPRTKERIVPL